MGVTGALGALTVVSTVADIAGGFMQAKAEKTQADTNAAIYDAQAKNIAEQQKITDAQYRAKGSVLRGEATATAARNGLRISGTTAGSISQSIMDLQMDNSYEQYNLLTKKQNAYSNAELERYKGSQAMANGYMKAGTTALNAASDYYNKYWKTSSNNFFGKKAKLSGGIDISDKATMYPTSIA